MNIADLMVELEGAGIAFWEEGGDALRYRADKGVLTAQRRELLREHKGAIIAQLRARSQRAQLRPNAAECHEKFPLTDIQIAYLYGRRDSFSYGGVGCHGYGELALRPSQVERVQTAWGALIRRHDMLRAVVYADGTQQVLSHVPEFVVDVSDLRAASAEEACAALERVRAKMDHRVYETDKWPLFDLCLTLVPGQSVLHFSIDLLIADFVSTQVLLEELHQLLNEPTYQLPPIDVTFRDYVLANQSFSQSNEYVLGRAYWLGHLTDLPASPELPQVAQKPVGPPRFLRHALRISLASWRSLGEGACASGITASTVILTAFAEVVARWAREPRFTLNVTLQNRKLLHAHVDRLVGDFTSIELLAVDMDPLGTFCDRARGLQVRLLEDFEHRAYSGTEVMRELQRRGCEGAGAFPIVFTSSLGRAGGSGNRVGGLSEFVHGITQTPQVSIDCQVMEGQDGLIVNWDVREGVFPPGMIADMFTAFETLLHGLATRRESWVAREVVRVPAAQLERRERANATEQAIPDVLLHEPVLAVALRAPSRVAVITSSGSISFGELASRASNVAGIVRSQVDGPGAIVAIAISKGVDQIVAVLGVLLAGCVYLPLDNDQPAARRQQILTDSGAEVVLVREAIGGSSWAPGSRIVSISEVQASRALCAVPPRMAKCDDPAYLIYTSGSSGVAKGVAVSHVSAVNTISDINARFAITSRDRVLGVSSLGFDLSVYDIFGVLAVGGALVLPDECRRADPSHWAQLISDHQITLWNSVPALMGALHSYLIGEGERRPNLASLRLALLSGDWIPVKLPEQIRALLPSIELVSLGGATEAAIWSIFYPIERVLPEWVSIPYGRPLANQRFHVLDKSLRPCPDWVTGELFIGGIGLALKYWNDAHKTAERFIDHPHTGERLYRTGDWGRYRDDGTIEFLGRNDRQVKIRGYRIELAEVEAGMATVSQVGHAAVVAHGNSSSDRRLVAFVEPAICDAATAVSSIDAPAEIAATSVSPSYGEYAASLEQLSLWSMLVALHERGLLAADDESASALSALPPQRRRLINRWMAALESSGILSRDVQRPTAGIIADAKRRLPELRRQVRETSRGVEIQELVELYLTIFERLPALIAHYGQVHVTIPVDEQRKLLQHLYVDAALSKWAREAMTASVLDIAARHSGSLRILELGALAGGSSVSARLARNGMVDATLTDPSNHVLECARRELGTCDRLRLRTFNVELAPRPQGLLPNSFDVIVACNILHRACDVGMALERVRELLSSGGWLVFAEPIRDQYPILASLEWSMTLDRSSGDFLDMRRGRKQTFLTTDQWKELIARAEGEIVYSIEQHGLHVFGARFKAQRAPIDAARLTAAVAEVLPPYMIPSQVQVVDQLPLSANGKVDYKQLSAWLSEAQTATVEAPSDEHTSDIERRLSDLWREALGASEVARDQGFLALGGDSLIAARLAGRIREQIAEAAPVFFDELLQEMLKGGSVASVAAMLRSRERSCEQTPAVEVEESLPVAVRKLGGNGEPVRVLVPHGAAFLSGYELLIGMFTAHGSLFGIESAETSVEIAARRCLDQIINDGQLDIEVVGVGDGVALAFEVARQMLEAGGRVQHLFLIGDSISSDDCQATAYAGDMTILLGASSAGAKRAVEFWRGICLGELAVREIPSEDPRHIAEAVLTTRAMAMDRRSKYAS